MVIKKLLCKCRRFRAHGIHFLLLRDGHYIASFIPLLALLVSIRTGFRQAMATGDPSSNIIGAYLLGARMLVRRDRLVRSDRIDGRARAAADGHWGSSQQKFPALAFCRFFAELLQVAVVEDVDAHGHQNKLVNR